MNRSELIDSVAQRSDLARREAELVVNTIFDSLFDAIQEGRRVEIRGFGSFTTRHYDSYVGRNPKTGAKVDVNKKRLPFFKVGKDLRERVS